MVWCDRGPGSLFLFFPLFIHFLSFLDNFCHIFSGTSKSRHLIYSIMYTDKQIKSSCIVIVTKRITAPIYISNFFLLFFCIQTAENLCYSFFATFLLLLIYSRALLKQCSGAIVRFSDSSSLLFS